jgi:hypothetical protein
MMQYARMRTNISPGTYAVAASAVAFACTYQAVDSGEHWLAVTGCIFLVIALVQTIKALARQAPGR